MKTFKQHESQVRSYVRSFPAVFEKAKGSILCDEQGKEYIDFFAGAGTLNYGHNNPLVSKALVDYINKDGIIHGLDKATTAKKQFLDQFYDTILQPRHMEYKIQFTGPTGTNAVESALKLVRMVKGRSNVISFTNAFHGLTMGSMAVTANAFYRDEAFINRTNVSFMPFDGYFGEEVNTAEYLRTFLEDQSSGVDLPAAIILETIQAEGGINVASDKWLQDIEQICRDFDILLIVDDIQVGNGRTGTFFSFENAGINPDIITLSKSIGGGLPLSMVLLKGELDQWKPGEHTGTFRGNNLAFVASRELLSYWENDSLSQTVQNKEKIIKERLNEISNKFPTIDSKVRGKGMICGLKVPLRGFCGDISEEAFSRGLLIELAGAQDDVLKLLPPLTIENDLLQEGLQIIEDSIASVLERREAMVEGLNHDS
ncbi:diaminobutyrate--2-oxoglutarate transaminase [Methanobacterium alkalithermotolerans]|uniref:Diaminobutyrate--2-oxoglutarate transaminase n=1 Tax=Methanobacterium alkalithermotolerans TaxID=2731220 RepID=A0A8T8K7F5_9EURY|nr:diaminobutyrate--2-oxoglutarate transaminase [Methanobacterium alkalithermotolerans]QUH23957.1 diaminobutyrate--2-oxoglutarate transaminase [Methanobacterium alkalithermotolerans]